jgi:hypothetical protein
MSKIKQTDDNLLIFEDGMVITCDHEQDCCEYNYADFNSIDDICRATDFDTENLCFEVVDGSGFRFGNKPDKMFFVPCYSSQNGYYSDQLDIYYKGECQTTLTCEEDYC